MNKQKGLAPILIVILVALVVGGYLLYQKQFKPIPGSQPSPSPVTTPIASSSAETVNPDSIGANWKTYTNMEYVYSVKYPQGWKVREHDSGTTVDVDFLSVDYQAPSTGAVETVNSGARINIVVYTSQNIPSLSTWFNQYFYDPRNKTVLYQPKQITVDLSNSKNVTALEYETSKAEGSVYSKLFNTGPKDVIVQFTVTTKNDLKQYKSILTQILSTFKFTN